jgi:hypothetical protein
MFPNVLYEAAATREKCGHEASVRVCVRVCSNTRFVSLRGLCTFLSIMTIYDSQNP